MQYSLSCTRCSRRFHISAPLWKCSSCGGTLAVVFEDIAKGDFDSFIDKGMRGLWRYRKLIPLPNDPVTLGEGCTPTVMKKESKTELCLKLEYISPTGAFKDRGASVSVTRAKGAGAKYVVEDSTGNAGIAAAAYSAKAGIKARIYVPSDAPRAKKMLISAFGAEVVECSSRDEAATRSKSELKMGEVYIGHMWDPFYIEGMKTIAYEVYENGHRVDSVVVPVASGTILLGIYGGFRFLESLGLVDNFPSIYAVQGEGCAPLYEALHGRMASGRSSQLADGLRIKDPPRKDEILKAIRETGGDVFMVSDEEIAPAVKELYRMGIMAEPTSATVYAAFRKNENELKGRVLMPITGTGMKNTDSLAAVFGNIGLSHR